VPLHLILLEKRSDTAAPQAIRLEPVVARLGEFTAAAPPFPPRGVSLLSLFAGGFKSLFPPQLLTGRRAGLVFGRTPTTPFDTGGIWKRSRAAWEEAELQPITLTNVGTRLRP
jgi:hypothetical protein